MCVNGAGRYKCLRPGEDGRAKESPGAISKYGRLRHGLLPLSDAEGKRLKTLYLGHGCMPESGKLTGEGALASEVADIRRARPELDRHDRRLSPMAAALTTGLPEKSCRARRPRSIVFWHACEHLVKPRPTMPWRPAGSRSHRDILASRSPWPVAKVIRSAAPTFAMPPLRRTGPRPSRNCALLPQASPSHALPRPDQEGSPSAQACSRSCAARPPW